MTTFTPTQKVGYTSPLAIDVRIKGNLKDTLKAVEATIKAYFEERHEQAKKVLAAAQKAFDKSEKSTVSRSRLMAAILNALPAGWSAVVVEDILFAYGFTVDRTVGMRLPEEGIEKALKLYHPISGTKTAPAFEGKAISAAPPKKTEAKKTAPKKVMKKTASKKTVKKTAAKKVVKKTAPKKAAAKPAVPAAPPAETAKAAE